MLLHPRPPRRLPDRLLARQRLRPGRSARIPESLSRVHGQAVRDQRAVGFLQYLQLREEVAGRGDGCEDYGDGWQLQGDVIGTYPCREFATGVWRLVSLRGGVLAE